MSGKNLRPVQLLKWLLALGALFGLGLFVMVKMDPMPYAHEAALKSDLKNLARVQEMYLDDHERYTDDLAALRYMSSDGATIRLEADADSWAATAEYDSGSFPFRIEIDCALVMGSLSVASWGAIDMTTLIPGEVRCEMG